MVKIPAYLKKGDTIGLVCPSGYMDKTKTDNCVSALQSWGFKVKIGETVGGKSENYFSGTDEERLNDFQKMLDDENVKAVLCARGGYGLSRIIDGINFKKFKKNPKWIIGFSDITVLLSHLFTDIKVASLHAPMANAFNEAEPDSAYILTLKNVLKGKKGNYTSVVHDMNKPGKAEGILVGGNLSLLVHMIGTKSDINTKGKILFLEEIGEQLYSIDRMMHQLKRSGKLDNLKGLVIGGFTENKDTERPFDKTIEQIISDAVKDYDYPVCYGFPVSHEKENVSLKVGVSYELIVTRNKVSMKEI
jgi:muramoyltetrapeptide carboxypeptidase